MKIFTLASASLIVTALASPLHAASTDPLVQHADAHSFAGAARDRGIDNMQSEDFEDSFARFLPDDEFAACVEPVTPQSNDACFEPGGVPTGMSLSSSNRYGVIVMGTDLLDTPSLVGGGWPYRSAPSSLNFTRIDFDDGPTVAALEVYGFRLESGSVNGLAAPVMVEVFDTDGLPLDSFTVEPDTYNAPVFVGIESESSIGQIQVGTREEGAGAMIDNLQFGGGPGAIDASPAALHFGAVAIDDVATLDVVVTNRGYLDATLAPNASPPPPFLLESDGCVNAVLAPGASCTLTFAFSPAFADAFDIEVPLPVVSPSQGASVRLTGTGTFGGAQ